MCGHLPLVCSSKCPLGKPQAFFSIVPQFTEKSAGHLLGGWSFPFSGTILSTGRCDSVHDDLWPCGDPDSLQSKEALVGRFLVNVSSSYPSHNASYFGEAISSNLLPLRYPSPEFLECRSVFVSDFNLISPVKPMLPSRAIYMGHG